MPVFYHTQLTLRFLLFTSCLLLGALATGASGADAPEPVTADTPGIDIEELKLMVTPLPKSQLLVEANAWQALLQDKAQEIAEFEVAVERRNRAIEAAEVIAEEAPDAADAAERQEEVTEDAKIDLLEEVTALREQRTALGDRLGVVLDELERKTDDGDPDTLAIMEDHRLYASAVSGIRVNVEDSTSAWISIKGWLVSDEGGKRWAFNIARFLGILLVAWILSRFLSALIQRGLGRIEGTSRLLERFLVNAVRWIVMAIGLIMALAALEISIGPLLAVVGAAGFVIAFALQDSLSNFASGLMILFFKPFDEGDVIEAGGVSGKVETMNLVSTTIHTFDNKRMVVPNNKIWNDVITNATGVRERRVDMEFGIGYDADYDRAREILEEANRAHPKVLDDPEPVVRLHTLADSSVNFIVRPWALTEDYWDVYWDITREAKRRFDEAGISIPFPQRDVHLYVEGGEASGIFQDHSKTE
jgi:small conductance mechanosensitive channel